MGDKPLRPCRHPGCCQLVSDGFCAAHQPKRSDARSADAKRWHRLYDLPVWRKDIRPMQLVREPWCRECARHGVATKATEADHIVPHRGHLDLFLDRANLQSLCHTCHSRKTAAENHKFDAKKYPR